MSDRSRKFASLICEMLAEVAKLGENPVSTGLKVAAKTIEGTSLIDQKPVEAALQRIRRDIERQYDDYLRHETEANQGSARASEISAIFTTLEDMPRKWLPSAKEAMDLNFDAERLAEKVVQNAAADDSKFSSGQGHQILKRLMLRVYEVVRTDPQFLRSIQPEFMQRSLEIGHESLAILRRMDARQHSGSTISQKEETKTQEKREGITLDPRIRSSVQREESLGKVADSRLEYCVAASHYARAAELLADADTTWQWRCLSAKALSLLREGEEFGDKKAVAEAITTYRTALKLVPRDRRPKDWAATKHNLGMALMGLGKREASNAWLDEAKMAYEDALEVRTREADPMAWAETQDNLGCALELLAESKGDPGLLQAAISAFRQALEVRRREMVPLEWATTKSNLGEALRMLGEEKEQPDLLTEAVSSGRQALAEYSRTQWPLTWAMLQFNLSNALRALGIIEANKKTQFNLGNAQSVLDKNDGGRKLLEEAITGYRNAAEELTRERTPLIWARIQSNLGLSLQELAEIEQDNLQSIALLNEAIGVHRSALEIHSQGQSLQDWAISQFNLAVALHVLFKRTPHPAYLETAIKAYQGALNIFKREGLSYEGLAERNLAEAITLWRGLNLRGGY